MSFKLTSLLFLLACARVSAQTPNTPPTLINVPVVIPSVSELVENQKRRTTTDYIRRLKLQDPDITETGKLNLPALEPRVAFVVRYLFGTPDMVKAVIETQGTQRTLRTGDKLAGFDVRVSTQGVSLFITRYGRKEGWTEPLAPGLYQEYF
ncbi:MAG: hypothetical protein QM527_14565 [Alphaproteobacteria bacterium]|nr:hypothetical protein [Alphaproteobacteria bacterium]